MNNNVRLFSFTVIHPDLGKCFVIAKVPNYSSLHEREIIGTLTGYTHTLSHQY